MNQFETATFGAGCFWGIEETFRTLKGIKSTAVGYMGGKTKNPSYEEVCRHDTGHAEVLQMTYDPNEVSYETLLKIFWDNHNPTTRNRQGPDVGDQYRSVVFYHSPEQKEAAEKMKAEIDKSGKWKSPLVTEITPASEFWRAEDYHQQYLMKRGLGSCYI